MRNRAEESFLAYSIAEVRLSLAFIDLSIAEIKAGFREDQPRGCDGRWCGGAGSVTVTRRAKTGDPRIDATTDQIVDIFKEVIETNEPGDGFLYGIQIHAKLAARLRALDLPGIGPHGVEQSFVAGDVVCHGLAGSIRTDVILRNGRTRAAPIAAIWDIKTGEKGLSPSRVRALRAGAGVGNDVPVIEIHLFRGVSVKNMLRQILIIGLATT